MKKLINPRFIPAQKPATVQSPLPIVEIVFILGINLGLNLEEVLKFSMAWGISNTQHSEGGCIEKTEVDEIKEKVAVRRCSVTELDTTEKKF